MATSITLPKKPKTGKVSYLKAIIDTIKKNYKAGITDSKKTAKYDVATKEFPTMNKGGVVKKKSYKNGGVVIIDKSGSSHYKSKGNSKAIAKKYFKGTF